MPPRSYSSKSARSRAFFVRLLGVPFFRPPVLRRRGRSPPLGSDKSFKLVTASTFRMLVFRHPAIYFLAADVHHPVVPQGLICASPSCPLLGTDCLPPIGLISQSSYQV